MVIASGYSGTAHESGEALRSDHERLSSRNLRHLQQLPRKS